LFKLESVTNFKDYIKSKVYLAKEKYDFIENFEYFEELNVDND
jgi:hypothetical protein